MGHHVVACRRRDHNLATLLHHHAKNGDGISGAGVLKAPLHGWVRIREAIIPLHICGGSAIWRLFGDVRRLALEATMYLIKTIRLRSGLLPTLAVHCDRADTLGLCWVSTQEPDRSSLRSLFKTVGDQP